MRPYPDLLSEDEQKEILRKAEYLWDDLQKNNIGGYSGINRPFYILSVFKEVIEQFGNRDVGLSWSKIELENHSGDKSIGWNSMETAFRSDVNNFRVGPEILILTKGGDVHKARWTQGYKNTLGWVSYDSEGAWTWYADKLEGWMPLPSALRKGGDAPFVRQPVIDELIKVLDFYANKSNYSVGKDNGDLARFALEAYRKENP